MYPGNSRSSSITAWRSSWPRRHEEDFQMSCAHPRRTRCRSEAMFDVVAQITYQRCVVTQVSCVNSRIDRLRPHLQARWIATPYHFAVPTKPINLKSDPELHSPTEFGSSFQVSNQCMLCTAFSQSDQSRFRYRQLANMLSRGCICRYVPQT